MTPSGDETALEVTTIRLPCFLKRVISMAAKEHGLSFSEELRDALQMHYKKLDAAATLKDIHDAITIHEAAKHQSDTKLPIKISLEGGQSKFAPSRSSNLNPSELEKNRDKIFADESRAAAKLVLEKLHEHLKKGEEITSRQLEEETGVPRRLVGRLLKLNGVQSRNTRVKNVSGRYFLLETLPAVEMALSGLEVRDHVQGASKT